MGDSHVGLQARLMSQALRKLTGHIKRTNTLVVFINQIRMKIGVMFGSLKPQPAVTRSNSTPPSASTSAVPVRLKKAMTLLVTKPKSKSSKTKLRLRSVKPNSIFFTAKASAGKAN